MKTKSFFSLIAAAFVAVACQPKGPEFTPSFEVNGASLKDGKIAVEAAGAKAKLAVASNVSWAVDASEDWVVVTPAKADITDKALKTTEVTVAVSANEAYEPRQATLTLSATDVNLPSIVVTINQAAAVKPEALFQVLDSDLKDVTSLDVAAAAGNASVIVNANVSWTASADAAWCTIEPANATIEGYEETPTTVTLSFEANTVTEGRSCNVTFTPAEGEPVVVAINQAADVPFTVDVALMSVKEYAGGDVPGYPDTSCRITVMENPTKTVTAGYYGVWQSAAWTQAELDDPMELLLEYANEMEADELDGLNGVEGADPCEWIWSKLNPGTEYVFVTGFVAEDGSVYTAYSKSTTDKEEDPGEAEAAYTKWIGSYSFQINGKTHAATISANVVNKSFIVDLSGADNSYIEDFAPVATWDKANDKLTIAEQTMGQWEYTGYGTITDHIYGMINYNGGHPMITGNGYPIASLSYNSGNVVIESAGSINITGLGEMPLVGMSLFGVASAGNLRYCDEEDFMFFPVALNKAVASAPASTKSGKAAVQTVRKAFGVKKVAKAHNFVELR